MDPNLLPPYRLLSNLQMKRGLQRVFGRIIRVWEVTNPKNGNEIISLNFLLLDEKDSTIMGSISNRFIAGFAADLIVGAMILIDDFEVWRSGSQYRISDHVFTIRLTDRSSINHVTNTSVTIKADSFRLRDYKQLLEIAGQNMSFDDVVCSIIEERSNYNEYGSGKERVSLDVMLQCGSKVRITLWDKSVNSYRDVMGERNPKGIVLILTSVNPKTYSGYLYLNSTHATKLYTTDTLGVIDDFKKRHVSSLTNNNGDLNQSTNTIVEISDILTYISGDVHEVKEFKCEAVVNELLSTHGWNYVSCNHCPQKLQKVDGKLLCKTCTKPDIVGILRYRLDLVVSDKRDSVCVTVFNKEISKILNISATDMIKLSESKFGSSDDEVIIRFLSEIFIGKVFKFDIRVTSFNFKSSSAGLTVIGMSGDSTPINLGSELVTQQEDDALGQVKQSPFTESVIVKGGRKKKSVYQPECQPYQTDDHIVGKVKPTQSARRGRKKKSDLVLEQSSDHNLNGQELKESEGKIPPEQQHCVSPIGKRAKIKNVGNEDADDHVSNVDMLPNSPKRLKRLRKKIILDDFI